MFMYALVRVLTEAHFVRAAQAEARGWGKRKHMYYDGRDYEVRARSLARQAQADAGTRGFWQCTCIRPHPCLPRWPERVRASGR